MIIFVSILTTFEVSVIFWGSRGSLTLKPDHQSKFNQDKLNCLICFTNNNNKTNISVKQLSHKNLFNLPSAAVNHA